MPGHSGYRLPSHHVSNRTMMHPRHPMPITAPSSQVAHAIARAIVPILLFFPSAGLGQAVQGYTRHPDGVFVQLGVGTLQIQPLAENAVRIRYGRGPSPAGLAPGCPRNPKPPGSGARRAARALRRRSAASLQFPEKRLQESGG